MVPKKKSYIVLSLLIIFLSEPAYSASPVYMWKDSNGVNNFGDDPENAPAGAKVTVWPENRDFQKVSEMAQGDMEMNDVQSTQAHRITQGTFAVQLVKELGIRRDASPREASDILSSIRIAPPLGHWKLNQPMTPRLTLRLRQLSVAAAEEGWIKIEKEQALLAFDTSAALLGINIPMTGPFPSVESISEGVTSGSPSEPPPVDIPSAPARPEGPISDEEMPAMPAGDAPEAIYSAYPVLTAPPLVTLIMPPPAFYPYYVWYPVAGGFWCNSNFYSGYYVLNGDRYFYRRDGHYYHGGRLIGGFSSAIIFGQVRSRIINGQFRHLSNTPQIHFGPGSMSAANRIVYPPLRPIRNLSVDVSHTRSIQFQNTHFFPQSANRPVTQPQPNSFRAVNQIRSFRHAYQVPLVYHYYGSPASARTLSSPAGHGFVSGSIGRSPGPSYK